MIKKILEKNAALVCRHPVYILVATGIITFLFLIPALRLKGSFNILKLLPENSKQVRNLHRLLEEFGGEDRFYIALEPGSRKEQRNTEKFIDVLLRTIKENNSRSPEPFFRNIGSLSSDESDWIFEFLFENGIYFLGSEGIGKIIDRLSDAGIANAVKEDAVLIKSGSPMSRKRVKRDPLNLSSIFLDAVPPSFRNISGSYYRSSEDNSLYIITLQPVELPQNGAFSTKLLRFSRQCVDEAAQQFNGVVPAVTFAGGYALAASDTSRILGVILKTFLVSLVVISCMLYIGFKELRILFFVIPGLAVSILWTAGFAGLLFGEITVVTAAFAAVLLGLGVDFAIHIYNRFRIELSAGKQPVDALRVAHTRTGSGILMGAFTTSAAFYILALSDFTGMREFGILVGTGVLFSVFLYFTLFSALLFLFSGRVFKSTFTRSFGLGRMYDTVLKPHPAVVFLVFLSLAAAGIVYLLSGGALEFESDPGKLRPADDPVMERNRRLSRKIGVSLVQFPVVVEAGSFQDILERTHALSLDLDELKQQEKIKDYKSPGQVFKTVQQQKKNIELLRPIDLSRVRSTLRKELSEHRFKPAAFEETFMYLDTLERKIQKGETLSPEHFIDSPLNRLTSGFLKMYPEQGRYISLSVFLTEPGTERSFDLDEIGRKIERGGDSVFISGVNVISRAVMDKIAWWFMRILPAVFSVIMILLFINFGSLRYSLMAAGPLCIGVLLLWTSMKLFDIRLNVMNFGIIPLVIGMGVDNGIHIIRGYLDSLDDADPIRDSLSITGRAVVMTSLTTIAGFGSLMLGEYRGIMSMGIIASLGIGYCLIATLLFLPAALRVFPGKNRQDKI